MNENKKEIIKYDFLYYIRYTGDAFFYPFVWFFFNSLGYQNSQISYILLIAPAVSFFVNPFWSIVSKNANSNKIIGGIFSVIEAVAIVLLIYFNAPLYLAIIVFLIISIAGQPFYILLDGYTVNFCTEIKYEYTKIRIFGSISYTVATLIAAILINRMDYTISFYVAGGLFILTSVIMFLLRPLESSSNTEIAQKADLKLLFKNKYFYFFSLVFILWISTQTSIDSYLGGFFKDIYSYDRSQYMYIMFGFILTEVIVIMLLFKFGEKINVILIVLLGMFANILRYFLNFLQLPVPVIIIASMLRGISMSFYIYSYFRILKKIVKQRNITAANLITNSVASVYRVSVILAGGYIANDPSNYKYLFLIGIILTVVGTIFIVPLAKNRESVNYDV